MNEGAPIQDSLIPTPDVPQDSFGIRNLYNPGSHYSALTKDHKSHLFFLENNWKNIIETGYDPIFDVNMFIFCDLRAKTEPNVNRFAKNFFLYSRFHTFPSVLHEYNKNAQTFSNFLSRQGVDVDLFAAKEGERKFPSLNRVQDSFPFPYRELKTNQQSVYFVSKQDCPEKIAINISSYAFDHWSTDKSYGHSWRTVVELIAPWPQSNLESLEDFTKAEEVHFKITEKLIRGFYKEWGKDLPPEKLEFKPRKEISTESKACQYCNSGLTVINCPQCGGPNPAK